MNPCCCHSSNKWCPDPEASTAVTTFQLVRNQLQRNQAFWENFGPRPQGWGGIRQHSSTDCGRTSNVGLWNNNILNSQSETSRQPKCIYPPSLKIVCCSALELRGLGWARWGGCKHTSQNAENALLEMQFWKTNTKPQRKAPPHPSFHSILRVREKFSSSGCY
eukprot:6489156-Amphidinium_carterae.1